jgi:hypothetical protein
MSTIDSPVGQVALRSKDQRATVGVKGAQGSATYYDFDGAADYVSLGSGWETLGDASYESITYNSTNDQGYVVPATRPLTEFGRVGANYHDGGIWNFRLGDGSPVQNQDAPELDGSTNGELPTKVPLQVDWGIEWDGVFQTGDQHLLSNNNMSTYFAVDGNNLVLYRGNELVTQATDAVNGWTNDQHYSMAISSTNGDITIRVDNTSYNEGTGADQGVFLFSRFGGDTPPPNGSVITNARIYGNVGEEYLTWDLDMQEGSGTDITNSNSESIKFSTLPNGQTSSIDLTGTGTGGDGGEEGDTDPVDPGLPPGSATLLHTSDFSSYLDGDDGFDMNASSSGDDGWAVQPSVIKSRMLFEDDPEGVYDMVAAKLDLRRADFLSGGIAYDPSGYPSPRVQLMKSYNDLPFQKGKDYAIGQLMRWDPDWIDEVYTPGTSANGELFWQIHGVGGTSTTGPLTLDWNKSNSLEFAVRHGNWSIQPQTVKFDLGALTKGDWENWIIMFQLSTGLDGHNGYCKVYRDGVLVVDYSGPTYYYTNSSSNSDGGYFTPTMYKAKYHKTSVPTNNTTRELWYAQIRIAEGTGQDAYDLVNPDNYTTLL